MERFDAYNFLQTYVKNSNIPVKTTSSNTSGAATSYVNKAPSNLQFNFNELNQLFIDEGLNALLEMLTELKEAGLIEKDINVNTDRSTGKTTVSCVCNGITYEFSGAQGEEVTTEPEVGTPSTVSAGNSVDDDDDKNDDKFDSPEALKAYIHSQEFLDVLEFEGVVNTTLRDNIINGGFLENILGPKYDNTTKKDVWLTFRAYYSSNGGKIEKKENSTPEVDFKSHNDLVDYLKSIKNSISNTYVEYIDKAINNIANKHEKDFTSVTKNKLREELETECKRLYEEATKETPTAKGETFKSFEELHDYIYGKDFRNVIKDAGIVISEDKLEYLQQTMEKYLKDNYADKTKEDVFNLFEVLCSSNGIPLPNVDFRTFGALENYLATLLNLNDFLPPSFNDYKDDAVSNVADRHKDDYRQITKLQLQEELKAECKKLYDADAVNKNGDFKSSNDLHEYLYSHEFSNTLNEKGYVYDIEKRNYILQSIEDTLQYDYAGKTKIDVLDLFNIIYISSNGVIESPYRDIDFNIDDFDIDAYGKYFIKNDNDSYTLNRTLVKTDFPENKYGKINDLNDLKNAIDKKSNDTFDSYEDLEEYLFGNAEKEFGSYDYQDKYPYKLLASCVASLHIDDFAQVTEIQLLDELSEVYELFVIDDLNKYDDISKYNLDDEIIKEYFKENKEGYYEFDLVKLMSNVLPEDLRDVIDNPSELPEAIKRAEEAKSDFDSFDALKSYIDDVIQDQLVEIGMEFDEDIPFKEIADEIYKFYEKNNSLRGVTCDSVIDKFVEKYLDKAEYSYKYLQKYGLTDDDIEKYFTNCGNAYKIDSSKIGELQKLYKNRIVNPQQLSEALNIDPATSHLLKDYDALENYINKELQDDLNKLGLTIEQDEFNKIADDILKKYGSNFEVSIYDIINEFVTGVKYTENDLKGLSDADIAKYFKETKGLYKLNLEAIYKDFPPKKGNRIVTPEQLKEAIKATEMDKPAFESTKALRDYIDGLQTTLEEIGLKFEKTLFNDIANQVYRNIQDDYKTLTKNQVIDELIKEYHERVTYSKNDLKDFNSDELETYFIEKDDHSYTLNLAAIKKNFPNQDGRRIVNPEQLKQALADKDSTGAGATSNGTGAEGTGGSEPTTGTTGSEGTGATTVTGDFESSEALHQYVHSNNAIEYVEGTLQIEISTTPSIISAYHSVATDIANKHANDWKTLTKLEIIKEIINEFEKKLNEIKSSSSTGATGETEEPANNNHGFDTYNDLRNYIFGSAREEIKQYGLEYSKYGLNYEQIAEAVAGKHETDYMNVTKEQLINEFVNEYKIKAGIETEVPENNNNSDFDSYADLRNYMFSGARSEIEKLGLEFKNLNFSYENIADIVANKHENDFRNVTKEQLINEFVNEYYTMAGITHEEASETEGAGETGGTPTGDTQNFKATELQGLHQSVIDRYFIKNNDNNTYSLNDDTIAKDFPVNEYGKITTPDELKEAIKKQVTDAIIILAPDISDRDRELCQELDTHYIFSLKTIFEQMGLSFDTINFTDISYNVADMHKNDLATVTKEQIISDFIKKYLDAGGTINVDKFSGTETDENDGSSAS